MLPELGSKIQAFARAAGAHILSEFLRKSGRSVALTVREALSYTFWLVKP
jgi:hypothetical protein